MHEIIKELQEILEKSTRKNEDWDYYFDDQLWELEEVIGSFAARMSKHEDTDWEEERREAIGDRQYEESRYE